MTNIIVTGASSGVGRGLVKLLASSSENQVIGIARSQSKLEFLSEEIESMKYGGKFVPLVFDLEQTNFTDALIPQIMTHMSSVDVLINNAGLLINKPFSSLTDDDFDRMFHTNVKAVFRLVRDLLPLLNKGAHVVNISSMGGFQGSAKFPGLSLYSASKAAVAVLTESMAEEFSGLGIKANALALGAVQTEMLAEAFPGYEAPLKAHEMAEFIADFALHGHRFFNGKVLPVSVSTP